VKTYKEVIKKVLEIDEYKCDICDADMKNKIDYFQFNEITIEAKIGYCFPEGDSRTKYSIDVCADCFVDKVIPLFKEELGVDFREEECG
jgi:hypothetical protein